MWIDENGDACVEMMNAMEKMTTMNEEGQKQLSEHKRRMAEADEYLKKGKLPPGVGPVNKGQQQRDLPMSFPDENYVPPK